MSAVLQRQCRAMERVARRVASRTNTPWLLDELVSAGYVYLAEALLPQYWSVSLSLFLFRHLLEDVRRWTHWGVSPPGVQTHMGTWRRYRQPGTACDPAFLLHLRDGLAGLRPLERETLLACTLRGATVPEVAAQRQVSLQTVYQTLARARQKLRRAVEETA